MPLRRLCRNLVLAAALLGVLASLAGLGGGVPSAAAQTADEPAYAAPVKTLDEALKTGRIRQETVDTVRKYGSAPVLVRVRLPSPFRPEGELNEAEAAAQRQAIAKGQSAIVQKLTGQKVADVKRYQTIPSLALVADEAALTALVAMSDVLRVNADKADDPQLATSATLTGAAAVQNALGNAGAGQTIAILDTGVDSTHPFLQGKVVSEACYSTTLRVAGDAGAIDLLTSLCPGGADSTAAGSGAPCPDAGCDHGTHVAGIAAGNGAAAGVGFSGVAPSANIIAIQVFSRISADRRTATWSDLLQGLERVYALRSSFQIAAVNLSLSGGFYTDRAQCDDERPDQRDIVANLRGAGIATVAASGNISLLDPFKLGIGGPACVSGVISVGSTVSPAGSTVPGGSGPIDGVASFSQTAEMLTLLAPGTNICSSGVGSGNGCLGAGSGFAGKDGTSMAAPHVAGAFAVLRALEPGRGLDAIRDTLITTGKPITDTRPATLNPPAPSITRARLQLDAAVESRLGRLLQPTGLQVVDVTGTSIEARWADNSAGEAGFTLTAVPLNAPLLPSRQATVGRNQTTATVGTQTTADGTTLKLQPNTEYRLTVRACDAAGRCAESAPLTKRTKNTLPAVPTNLRIDSRTASSFVVRWDQPGTNPVAYYRVRWSLNGNAQAPIDIRGANGAPPQTWGRGNLTGNWSVNWVLQACGDERDLVNPCSGDAVGPQVQVPTPVAAPAAPSNLHLCGGMEFCQAGYVTLIWDDNSANEDRFEFEWSRAQAGTPPDAGVWTRVVLAANDEGHALPSSSLSSGGLYYFRVRACNAGGCSVYSNRVDYTAP